MNPARGLIISELRSGIGREAELGDSVLLRVRCQFSGGEVLFADSGDDLSPVRLGARDAIVAVEHGALGMRVGEIRRVKAPPNLTYVERSIFPELSPDAPLIYEIELIRFDGTWTDRFCSKKSETGEKSHPEGDN